MVRRLLLERLIADGPQEKRDLRVVEPVADHFVDLQQSLINLRK